MSERGDLNTKDHDLLTRIDANLENFMTRFTTHTEDDTVHLNRLYARTARLEKIVWMALGVIAAAEFALRAWK